jgi:hypothetical protein
MAKLVYNIILREDLGNDSSLVFTSMVTPEVAKRDKYIALRTVRIYIVSKLLQA